jgi:hemerythrin superfamily protein
MNIDERLEALTHSVELLAAMHKETDKEMKRLGKYVRSVMQIVLDHRNAAAER